MYFRISEDEFEQMLKACNSKGARSVSDLARSAVQEFIKEEQPDLTEQMAGTVKTLQCLLEEIRSSVRELISTSQSASPSALERTQTITFTAGGQES